MATPCLSIDDALLAAQLDRILASPGFLRATRSSALLRYLVAAATAPQPRPVKEFTIASEVFDRGAAYDPAIDATVRVEAGRLRARLRDYYAGPGREDPLFIELPLGGYRVVLTPRPPVLQPTPVQPIPVPAIPVPATPAPVSSPALSHPHSRSRRSAWAILLPLLALPGLIAWKLHRRPRPPAPIHSIAVLPLRNLSGDPAQDYFADGATDELITGLARVPTLRVTSWTSASQEKDTRRPLTAIAAELHAQALVEGSVARSGDHVRINTRLVDAASGSTLWAGSLDGSPADLLALEDGAARQVAGHLGLSLPPALTASSLAVPPAAHDAWLRGRGYFDRRQPLESAAEFQRAIDLDPGYAAAWAGLSIALESQVFFNQSPVHPTVDRALAAASHALQLDPANGDALIARGSIETSLTWQWDATRSDLTRGIALSPANSYGHMMLSIYADSIGDPAEAIRQMQSAVEIDPLSFYMARHYGSVLYYAHRYEDALRQLLYVRSTHPINSGTVDNWLTGIYERLHRYDDAVRYDLLYLQDDDPHADLVALRKTWASHGWKAYWSLRLRGILASGPVPLAPPDPCRDYDAGIAALRAGLPDRALTLLDQATQQHCYWMGIARQEPALDDLRDDPRFTRILDRLNLPPRQP